MTTNTVAVDKIFCGKCKKTLDQINFYTHKDGSKCAQCKKCQTMHIDNYDPDTFLWLLKDMDVPYVEQEWNSLRDKAAQKASQTGKPLTGMSVYGKYLSKMKLKQWQGYTWADTEKLQAEVDRKLKFAREEGKVADEDHLKKMLDDGEISEAEYKTLSTIEPPRPPEAQEVYPANNPGFVPVPIKDFTEDLTEDDMMYLAIKWGRFWTPSDWVSLERLYNDMMNSFDIQGAAREDTMKKICMTSLKMDQAIEAGDVDVFQKLSRVYEPLMKSGKFTEAQNKEDGKGFVNSIGELVAFCEKEESFIPRYNIEVPQDIVDKTIMDMNKYTYNLVTKDMGLGQQIEDAIAKIQQQREMELEEEELNTIEDIEAKVLEDIDHEEFYAEIEAQQIEDEIAEFAAMAGE